MEFKLFHFSMKQSYFSTYVKRLIQRDMEQGNQMFSHEWESAYEDYMADPKEYLKNL
ncbi:hypothetical protein FBHYGVHD_CDS0090 [Staphylococcus phage MVC_VPHSA1]|nr:hypothetical protein FBHYGVHD_CDS0090 [Staphylococcus phage MVC_VPHSA1]